MAAYLHKCLKFSTNFSNKIWLILWMDLTLSLILNITYKQKLIYFVAINILETLAKTAKNVW